MIAPVVPEGREDVATGVAFSQATPPSPSGNPQGRPRILRRIALPVCGEWEKRLSRRLLLPLFAHLRSEIALLLAYVLPRTCIDLPHDVQSTTDRASPPSRFEISPVAVYPADIFTSDERRAIRVARGFPWFRRRRRLCTPRGIPEASFVSLKSE